MSQKSRPTFIEMRQKPQELDSSRSMMKNLINNQQSSPQKLIKNESPKANFNGKYDMVRMNERDLKKRERSLKSKIFFQKDANKQIFDVDFKVQQMSNPSKYLTNYNQNVNIDPCFADCQACCGQILICLGTFCSFCCTKCCVYQLSTSSAGLVEAFGKFSRLLKPGFNRINPCSEEVHEVDMKIKLLSTGRNVTLTKDNVKLTIETCVAFRIVNPILVYYKIGSELNRGVIELVISSFRKVIGENNLQTILTQRHQINQKVISQINQNSIQGIFIENVFLEDIILPHDIQRDLSSLARAKRIAQANLLETKADVQSAQLMKQTAELLDTKAAMQIRYLQLVQLIGKSGSTLVMDIGVNKELKNSY